MKESSLLENQEGSREEETREHIIERQKVKRLTK